VAALGTMNGDVRENGQEGGEVRAVHANTLHYSHSSLDPRIALVIASLVRKSSRVGLGGAGGGYMGHALIVTSHGRGLRGATLRVNSAAAVNAGSVLNHRCDALTGVKGVTVPVMVMQLRAWEAAGGPVECAVSWGETPRAETQVMQCSHPRGVNNLQEEDHGVT
jgi:hypothetical protein